MIKAKDPVTNVTRKGRPVTNVTHCPTCGQPLPTKAAAKQKAYRERRKDRDDSGPDPLGLRKPDA